MAVVLVSSGAPHYVQTSGLQPPVAHFLFSFPAKLIVLDYLSDEH